MVAKTLHCSNFFKNESCGQYPPCRMGTTHRAALMTKFEAVPSRIRRSYSAAEVSLSGSTGRGCCSSLGGVMPRVTFLHSDGRSGEVEEDISLLDAAKEVGFRLNHDCGGNASCTTCRVE